jgi:hypothetical protein
VQANGAYFKSLTKKNKSCESNTQEQASAVVGTQHAVRQLFVQIFGSERADLTQYHCIDQGWPRATSTVSNRSDLPRGH